MNDILIIPNSVLRQKSLPLKNITKKDIDLSLKMMKIMNNDPCIGLAAPQIGILKKIITINIKETENEKKINYALFNPEIISFSKKKVLIEEGCLSIPEHFAEIERPEKIHFKYFNESNELIEKEAIGNESRVIQHEIDHLNGKLFIDYLSSLKRNIIIKKIKKLKKLGQI